MEREMEVFCGIRLVGEGPKAAVDSEEFPNKGSGGALSNLRRGLSRFLTARSQQEMGGREQVEADRVTDGRKLEVHLGEWAAAFPVRERIQLANERENRIVTTLVLVTARVTEE